jgi:hypothetical protein
MRRSFTSYSCLISLIKVRDSLSVGGRNGGLAVGDRRAELEDVKLSPHR